MPAMLIEIDLSGLTRNSAGTTLPADVLQMVGGLAEKSAPLPGGMPGINKQVRSEMLRIFGTAPPFGGIPCRAAMACAGTLFSEGQAKPNPFQRGFAGMNPQFSFINVKDVASRYSVSVPTVWRWKRDVPAFPQPIKLSPGVTRWRVEDLEEWEKLAAE